MVIGTLAGDGWTDTFGTARRDLAGCGPAQSPPRCTKCNSPPLNGHCTNFISSDVALYLPLSIKGLKPDFLLPCGKSIGILFRLYARGGYWPGGVIVLGFLSGGGGDYPDTYLVVVIQRGRQSDVLTLISATGDNTSSPLSLSGHVRWLISQPSLSRMKSGLLVPPLIGVAGSLARHVLTE